MYLTKTKKSAPQQLRKWLILLAILLLPVILKTPTPAHAENPAYDHPGIVHGVHIPPIWQNNTEIKAYNDLIGKEAGIVMSYYPWDIQFEDWTCGFFDNTYRHRNDGGTPGVNDCMKDFDPNTPEIATTYIITWEPLHNPTGALACNVAPGGRTNLDAIINGSCDAYINDFARRLKGWHEQYGDRFLIRFAHEMNLQDHVWWQDRPDYPVDFRAAWQHVYDRFRIVGVSRSAAQFVWAPNYKSFPERTWNVLPNFYPGDAYVEWVGLSGYNWDGQQGQDPEWRTFDRLFV